MNLPHFPFPFEEGDNFSIPACVCYAWEYLFHRVFILVILVSPIDVTPVISGFSHEKNAYATTTDLVNKHGVCSTVFSISLSLFPVFFPMFLV